MRWHIVLVLVGVVIGFAVTQAFWPEREKVRICTSSATYDPQKGETQSGIVCVP